MKDETKVTRFLGTWCPPASRRPMRVIPSVTLLWVIAGLAASPELKASGEKPKMTTRAGASLPAGGMQASGPSSAYDVPPKFISGAAPIYPITRLRLREPGFAVISFVVDETGRTRDFRVEKTNYPFFGTHAIAAIQKWRFRPATKHGRPVSCRVHIPFNYRVGW
jgi:protein TonB